MRKIFLIPLLILMALQHMLYMVICGALSIALTFTSSIGQSTDDAIRGLIGALRGEKA